MDVLIRNLFVRHRGAVLVGALLKLGWMGCSGTPIVVSDGIGLGDDGRVRDNGSRLQDGGVTSDVDGAYRDSRLDDGTVSSDAATTGADASTPKDGAIPTTDGLVPTPVTLPDVTAANVSCTNPCYNLNNDPTCVPINSKKAKEIYDAFFSAKIPADNAAFQWAQRPDLATEELFKSVVFFGLPTSSNVMRMYAQFDFNPKTWQRDISKTNKEIFSTIHASTSDPYMPATYADRLKPYTHFNPYDYVPAAVTHYDRGTFSDITATQFVFRVKCHQSQMKEAFKRCPDCNDLITVHSRNDLYKIFEVRFVRMNAQSNKMEVSKPMKVISIDSAGHPYANFPSYPYWWGVNPLKLRAKWRAEMSGLMAQRVGYYNVSGSYGALIRLAKENADYDPNFYASVPDALKKP